MNFIVRGILEKDRDALLFLMREFYSSPAVFTNGSEKIFNTDIDNCISDNPYVEGFVFLVSEEIVGYSMIAKSYSTEFGRPCIWLEDIYVTEKFRSLGIGASFIEYISKRFPDSLLRLEVEEENDAAVRLYKRCGFDVIPYMEMKKET